MLRRSGVLLFVLAGCGEVTTPCETNDECRDAFGLGSVCNADSGFCDQATLPARCNDTEPPDLLEDPTKYKDAYVFAHLGDGSYDFNETKAVKLAVKQANNEGGFKGNDFAVLFCTYEDNADFDDLGYDSISGLGTELADNWGIHLFVGPYTSSQAQALYSAIEDRDALVLSPAATSPALTVIDGAVKTDEDPGTFWRTAPPDSLQGEVAALDIFNRGSETVGVIYEQGAYGEGLFQIFAGVFDGLGGTIPGSAQFLFGDENARDAAIAAVQADNTLDEVMFIGSTLSDVIAFVNAAATSGFENTTDPGPEDDKQIFLTDGASYIQLITDTSASSSAVYDQLRGTRPSVDESTLLYKGFATAYTSAFGSDPAGNIYAAYAYDAGWLALYSIVWSVSQEGSITEVGLGRGLRKVSDASGSRAVNLIPTGWNSGTAYFEDGAAIDVTGVSGSLDFDPETEEVTAPIQIWRINDAKSGFDVVETIEP